MLLLSWRLSHVSFFFFLIMTQKLASAATPDGTHCDQNDDPYENDSSSRVRDYQVNKAFLSIIEMVEKRPLVFLAFYSKGKGQGV